MNVMNDGRRSGAVGVVRADPLIGRPTMLSPLEVAKTLVAASEPKLQQS
ncbi:MAG: hypothetical protein R3B91_00990 [Planctomycetaceae bacterium]